jgi:hypothetical protein
VRPYKEGHVAATCPSPALLISDCTFRIRSVYALLPRSFVKMLVRLFKPDKHTVGAVAPAAGHAMAVDGALQVQPNRRSRIVATLRPVRANKHQEQQLFAPDGNNKALSALQLRQILAPARARAPAPAVLPEQAMEPAMSMEEKIKVSCKDVVLAIFPDICPAYLERVAEERAYDAEQVTAFVADEIELQRPYPKRPKSTAKRKRDDSEEPEPDPASKFENPARHDGWDPVFYARLSSVATTVCFLCLS